MTFQNEHRNLIITVDTSILEQSKERSSMKLLAWLEVAHHDVFIDIEPWEGGGASIDETEIQLWGDNGLIIMDRVEGDSDE